MKKVIGALVAFLFSTSAWSATLLPNGEQQFIDANGKPYANGKVYFYSNYPTCSVLKNTFQDSAGSVLNTNPVVLSAMGTATIFGTGNYCQVLKDASGNTVWTKFTADTNAAASLGWGGTGGGTANAQTVTVSGFSAQVGQIFYYQPGTTNTGPATIVVNGGSSIAITKPSVSGYQPLRGGELAANTVVGLVYTSLGNFQLITNNSILFGSESTIAAATTTNLTNVTANVANITGSGVSITSFGTPGGLAGNSNSVFFLRFAAANTIVYNATSMITPSSQNVYVTAGDLAIVEYVSGGNWRVAGIVRADPTVSQVTGTTYAVTAADRAKTLVFTSSTGATVTVPDASTFNNSMSFSVQNASTGFSGSVTLTPSAGTINGAASFVLTEGFGFKLIPNGTDWQIVGSAQQFVWNGYALTSSGTSIVKSVQNPGMMNKRITVVLTDVGIGTTVDDLLVQIGDSTCSTFKTSGYSSSGTVPGTRDVKSTAGFIMSHGNTGTFNGAMTIYLTYPDPANIQYVENYTMGQYSANDESMGGGNIVMVSSPIYIGCIKLTTVTGTTAFTSGALTVFSE